MKGSGRSPEQPKSSLGGFAGLVSSDFAQLGTAKTGQRQMEVCEKRASNDNRAPQKRKKRHECERQSNEWCKLGRPQAPQRIKDPTKVDIWRDTSGGSGSDTPLDRWSGEFP